MRHGWIWDSRETGCPFFIQTKPLPNKTETLSCYPFPSTYMQDVAEVLKQSAAFPLTRRAQLYLPNQLGQELMASGQLIRLQPNPV